jgi:hypothetical protein
MVASHQFKGLGTLQIGSRRANPETVFGIMQSLVGRDERISAGVLLDRMMEVSARKGWPERVYRAASVEDPGSATWCKGYIVGSRWAKNMYFEDV